jgi:hypothetical protein
MVGYDTGPGCSGTIVHLDDASAFVLSARHCLVPREGGPQWLPTSRVRVFLARGDEEGLFWEPRPVQQVIVPRGAQTLSSWHDNELSDKDWALFVLAREPEMRAVELADAALPHGAPVTLVTLRSQDATDRPCSHGRPFRWGEVASIMMSGYSGAAVVANGRVHGIFVAGKTGSVWPFDGVRSLVFVAASSVDRPWIAGAARAHLKP